MSYWCADPNATYDATNPGNSAASDGIPVPLMPCGQYGAYLDAHWPACGTGNNGPGLEGFLLDNGRPCHVHASTTSEPGRGGSLEITVPLL